MLKRIIATALLLGVFDYSFSQLNQFVHFGDKNKNENESTEKFYVRLNFLGLVDGLDENFTPGLEYHFAPAWSTGADLGWIFYSKYFIEAKSASGIIFRPFIRYYVNTHRRGRNFFEAELHYKSVTYEIEDWVGRNPVNGVPAYEEYTTFPYHKHVYGVHLKGGHQTYLSDNDRLRMEFIYGFGIRWKSQGVKNGVYNGGGSIGNSFNPLVTSGVILLSLRLLYTIR